MTVARPLVGVLDDEPEMGNGLKYAGAPSKTDSMGSNIAQDVVQKSLNGPTSIRCSGSTGS